jgi:hypothetical protein
MNMRWKIGSLVAMTVLTGCASGPAPLAPEMAAKLKRLAVVSVVAEELSRVYVGFTVFGNEREQMQIGPWAVDQAYESQLAAAARQVLGSEVVPVQVNRADFGHVNDMKGPWSAPAFQGSHWELVERQVKSLCAQQSLDAVLLVAQRNQQDPFGGTNQSVAGLGSYARMNTSVLHLMASLAVLDCANGKPTVVRSVLAKAEGDGAMRTPVRAFTQELSRLQVAAWPESALPSVREAVIALPGSAWADTLKTLVPSPR